MQDLQAPQKGKVEKLLEYFCYHSLSCDLSSADLWNTDISFPSSAHTEGGVVFSWWGASTGAYLRVQVQLV